MHKAFANWVPRSGTNLVIKALLRMGMREAFHVSAGLVGSRTVASSIRRGLWHPLGKSYRVGIDTPVDIARRPIDARLRRLGAGAFGSGPMGYTSVLLDRLKSYRIRPVPMTRDPRAVLVSVIACIVHQPRHALHRGFRSAEGHARIERMLLGATVGGVELRSLCERCAALASWLEDPQVLRLKF